jgi:hypothetical protein
LLLFCHKQAYALVLLGLYLPRMDLARREQARGACLAALAYS